MRHLELHIIQSVPVACLNRDDLNSPKTAVFGGVQRARVSSQSWKRAIREMAKEICPDYFKGERTRLMYSPLFAALKKNGMNESEAEDGAKKIIDALVKLDSETKGKAKSKAKLENSEEIDPVVVKSKTLYFFSPLEINAFAETYAETKDVKKTLKKFGANSLKDAADICLFGRMVASDHSLTVEAASMFSHALSTHKVDNEIDFFSAVDDLQAKGEAGAGMTSTLEFNSATYYRFAALNLDMLADQGHLGALDVAERRKVVGAFIEATIKAIPGARKNTMNGNTLPVYVLGVVRDKGHPIQLINAFEEPLRTSSGYASKSIELLKAEYANIEKTWGITAIFNAAIPDVTMGEFLDGVTKHVF